MRFKSVDIPVVRRLVQEFWLPTLVASAWSYYNLNANSAPWTLRAVLNIFGPTFFLASWATGQFFRVKKQVSLDKNLNTIETRVDVLIQKLENHTKDFMGYVVGKDSVASFVPMMFKKDQIELGLLNRSAYPVFDVRAEVIDLDEQIDPKSGKLWTRHRFTLDNLFPNRMALGAYRFDMTGRGRLYINISIQTRGVQILQQLRAVREQYAIQIANRVRIDDRVVEQSVPDGFPGWDPNDPNKLFT